VGGLGLMLVGKQDLPECIQAFRIPDRNIENRGVDAAGAQQRFDAGRVGVWQVGLAQYRDQVFAAIDIA